MTAHVLFTCIWQSVWLKGLVVMGAKIQLGYSLPSPRPWRSKQKKNSSVRATFLNLHKGACISAHVFPQHDCKKTPLRGGKEMNAEQVLQGGLGSFKLQSSSDVEILTNQKQCSEKPDYQPRSCSQQFTFQYESR